jgi:hypothetical protein
LFSESLTNQVATVIPHKEPQRACNDALPWLISFSLPAKAHYYEFRMPRFATFDRRNYRTVAAHEGYAQWAATYEDTVKRDMDLWLLDQKGTESQENWPLAVKIYQDLRWQTGQAVKV